MGRDRNEPMDSIRIAMCQIVCLDGDRRGNLARIGSAVAAAARCRADIACLPESSLLGWVNPDAHTRAHPIPGEDSQRLCAMAAQHQLCLCAGLDEKDGDQLYDAAVLIDRGQILLKHRKIVLLSELMTPPYSAGADVQVAPTRFGRIGVLICADTHEQSILARMAALKPDLVLVPYGYAAEEEEWPEHGRQLERVVTHAAQVIGAPVVGTNLIGQIAHGPWTGRTYGGHSVAADRTGALLGCGADFDGEIRIVEIPRDD
jgi:predicted amidohydrolase